MAKKFKMGLLPLIIIAIAAGIGGGYVLPQWAARVFMTFNYVFSQFLGFCIPLIIVGFVSPAIADIGGRAGKMLVFTALLAYVATLCAGLASYFTGDFLFPRLIEPMEYIGDTATATQVAPYFRIDMPPLFGVMTALVLAFVLGLGASRLREESAMRGFLSDLRSIITMVINRAIIPLLPVYIFGIFMNMTIEGQVGSILMTFLKIIVVIFALHVLVLVVQYCVASLFSYGRESGNPFKLLWTMMPAYFTALGTQSSAATIPVTLKQTIKNGVDEDVAGFVVPLCATIHMSGSTLKIVACAMALMLSQGMGYDFSQFAGFIAMLGITIIAAPGVPGGAIMASLGLLSSMLGFSDADNAMMIALYIAMDSFGTACNVTGDGALAIIVNRFFGKRCHEEDCGDISC
ncbi:MAG: dicarboxylate/amino acid:cation symporter [Clostridiales bacterium]|nr:dicarboxylate/amino acid:cation symporter [Clostridiales bacterium]